MECGLMGDGGWKYERKREEKGVVLVVGRRMCFILSYSNVLRTFIESRWYEQVEILSPD